MAHRMRKQGVAYTGCKSEKPWAQVLAEHQLTS